MFDDKNLQEQISAITERLRGLREMEELSVSQMAEAVGKTEDEYLEYETGKRELSFSFLYNCANVLGVELTDILTGEGTRLNTYSVVKKSHGLHMERRKAYKYQHLAPIFKNRKMEPFLVTVEPGDTESAVAKHSHDGQEINYITKGSMIFYIDDNEEKLEEGDLVLFDASHPHAMKALDNNECQFLAIISR